MPSSWRQNYESHLLGFKALSNAQSKQGSRAVLVLAHLMKRNGTLDTESKMRADLGAKIFYTKKADFIITSGWAYRLDSDILISKAFREYLRKKHRINDSKILESRQSRDTVGDALFFRKEFLSLYKINELVIVTSDYHAARTKEIFEFILPSATDFLVQKIETNRDAETEQNEKKSLQNFRQTFAGLKNASCKDLLQRLHHKHPLYNGKGM